MALNIIYVLMTFKLLSLKLYVTPHTEFQIHISNLPLDISHCTSIRKVKPNMSKINRKRTSSQSQ